MRILKTKKLTQRKYLGEIIEIGTNNLRGYYKVKLLDYEDVESPIIWVKDGINRYVSESHGQYLPLLPGDRVIIEFTDELITSGVITKLHTSKRISDKLDKLDSEQLNNVNRYTLLRTDKNSRIVFDEFVNYAEVNFQNGRGLINYTPDNLSISHQNKINQFASTNISIISNNRININAQLINLDKVTGQNSINPANNQIANFKTFSTNLSNYKLALDSFNTQLSLLTQKHTEEDIDEVSYYEVLDALAKNQNGQNSILRAEFNPDTNEYIIHIKSIDTAIKQISDAINEQINNSKVNELIDEIQKNYEKNKNRILNILKDKLNELDSKINEALGILTEYNKTNTKAYEYLQAIKTFANNIRAQIENNEL